MPKACRVGNDETGSCTGIALDVPEAEGVGTGIDMSEAGVSGDVMGIEAEVAAVVPAADSLVVEIVVVRVGGVYCVMAELSGTE